LSDINSLLGKSRKRGLRGGNKNFPIKNFHDSTSNNRMDKDLGGVSNTSNNNNLTTKEFDTGLGGVSNTHNNNNNSNNNNATIEALDTGLGGVSNTHSSNNDSLLHRFKRRLRQRSILQ